MERVATISQESKNKLEMRDGDSTAELLLKYLFTNTHIAGAGGSILEKLERRRIQGVTNNSQFEYYSKSWTR